MTDILDKTMRRIATGKETKGGIKEIGARQGTLERPSIDNRCESRVLERAAARVNLGNIVLSYLNINRRNEK